MSIVFTLGALAVKVTLSTAAIKVLTTAGTVAVAGAGVKLVKELID